MVTTRHVPHVVKDLMTQMTIGLLGLINPNQVKTFVGIEVENFQVRLLHLQDIPYDEGGVIVRRAKMGPRASALNKCLGIQKNGEHQLPFRVSLNPVGWAIMEGISLVAKTCQISL